MPRKKTINNYTITDDGRVIYGEGKYAVENRQRVYEKIGIEFKLTPTVCIYCTRKDYFDTYHYFVHNGEPAAHDHPWLPNLGMPEPVPHAEHCPQLHKRTPEKDAKYRRLRRIKGFNEALPEENPDWKKKFSSDKNNNKNVS